MRVILLSVGEKKPSRHGGVYRRVIFRGVEDNKSYRLDVYENHPLSHRWSPYLRLQNVFDRVNILKGNIIDGKSDFIYVGQRHQPAIT